MFRQVKNMARIKAGVKVKDKLQKGAWREPAENLNLGRLSGTGFTQWKNEHNFKKFWVVGAASNRDELPATR